MPKTIFVQCIKKVPGPPYAPMSLCAVPIHGNKPMFGPDVISLYKLEVSPASMQGDAAFRVTHKLSNKGFAFIFPTPV